MSPFRTARQSGYLNILLIPLIAAIVLFVAALSFGAWAFNSRGTYKNHADKLVADAVAAAKQSQQKIDAAQYTEEAKNPLKTHVGPSAFGAVAIQYPKTWSGYIIEHTDNSGAPMNDYFMPDVVPDTSDPDNAYALHVQVMTQTYSQVMTQFNNLASSKKVTVIPYKLPKVGNVTGSRVDGQISAQKQGSMVVLPLRDVTLEISTESQAFANDFNNIILPNLTFSP